MGIGYDGGMKTTAKFVITHGNEKGERTIIRVPDGYTYGEIQNHPDLYTMEVGYIHMVGSAYCVHLDAPGIRLGATFARQMLRDVRSELTLRNPQFRSTPPVEVRV